MSKFLSFIHPVTSADEARAIIKDYTSKYHDARHVCWAYMIGPQRDEWQLNDNGEPSGTAGRPILGQINSAELTNVVIIVVRYFGGIKLGTPGLIAAYRESARLAIGEATVIEQFDMVEFYVTYPYRSMNDVMKIIKATDVKVLSQQFDNTCRLALTIRKDMYESICSRLEAVDGTSLTPAN